MICVRDREFHCSSFDKLRTVLSEPSVLNNLLHGGDAVASPPTHPSFKSRLIKPKQNRINPFCFSLCAGQDLNLQAREGATTSR